MTASFLGLWGSLVCLASCATGGGAMRTENAAAPTRIVDDKREVEEAVRQIKQLIEEKQRLLDYHPIAPRWAAAELPARWEIHRSLAKDRTWLSRIYGEAGLLHGTSLAENAGVHYVNNYRLAISHYKQAIEAAVALRRAPKRRGNAVISAEAIGSLYEETLWAFEKLLNISKGVARNCISHNERYELAKQYVRSFPGDPFAVTALVRIASFHETVADSVKEGRVPCETQASDDAMTEEESTKRKEVEYRTALGHYEDALTRLSRLDATKQDLIVREAITLNKIGTIHRKLGASEAASSAHLRAARAAWSMNDPIGIRRRTLLRDAGDGLAHAIALRRTEGGTNVLLEQSTLDEVFKALGPAEGIRTSKNLLEKLRRQGRCEDEVWVFGPLIRARTRQWMTTPAAEKHAAEARDEEHPELMLAGQLSQELGCAGDRQDPRRLFDLLTTVDGLWGPRGSMRSEAASLRWKRALAVNRKALQTAFRRQVDPSGSTAKPRNSAKNQPAAGPGSDGGEDEPPDSVKVDALLDMSAGSGFTGTDDASADFDKAFGVACKVFDPKSDQKLFLARANYVSRVEPARPLEAAQVTERVAPHLTPNARCSAEHNSAKRFVDALSKLTVDSMHVERLMAGLRRVVRRMAEVEGCEASRQAAHLKLGEMENRRGAGVAAAVAQYRLAIELETDPTEAWGIFDELNGPRDLLKKGELWDALAKEAQEIGQLKVFESRPDLLEKLQVVERQSTYNSFLAREDSLPALEAERQADTLSTRFEGTEVGAKAKLGAMETARKSGRLRAAADHAAEFLITYRDRPEEELQEIHAAYRYGYARQARPASGVEATFEHHLQQWPASQQGARLARSTLGLRKALGDEDALEAFIAGFAARYRGSLDPQQATIWLIEAMRLGRPDLVKSLGEKVQPPVDMRGMEQRATWIQETLKWEPKGEKRALAACSRVKVASLPQPLQQAEEQAVDQCAFVRKLPEFRALTSEIRALTGEEHRGVRDRLDRKRIDLLSLAIRRFRERPWSLRALQSFVVLSEATLALAEAWALAAEHPPAGVDETVWMEALQDKEAALRRDAVTLADRGGPGTLAYGDLDQAEIRLLLGFRETSMAERLPLESCMHRVLASYWGPEGGGTLNDRDLEQRRIAFLEFQGRRHASGIDRDGAERDIAVLWNHAQWPVAVTVASLYPDLPIARAVLTWSHLLAGRYAAARDALNLPLRRAEDAAPAERPLPLLLASFGFHVTAGACEQAQQDASEMGPRGIVALCTTDELAAIQHWRARACEMPEALE